MIQYIITGAVAADMERLAREALGAGCRWIELRGDASMSDDELREVVEAVKPLCVEADAFLLLADRVELAKTCEVSGVHLYKYDLPVSAARVTLEAAPVICVTVESADDVARLRGYDIDVLYMRLVEGAELARTVASVSGVARALRENKMELPLVVGGGFTAVSARAVLDAGASGIALLSDVDPAQTIREMQQALTEHS